VEVADMEENDDRLLKMLLSYRSYYGSYHDHKEKMAWLGALSLIAGCSFLLYSKYKEEKVIIPIEGPEGWIAFLIIVGTVIVLFKFVHFQLKGRKFAATVELASTNLITCILQKCEMDLRPAYYKNQKDRRFPKALVEQMNSVESYITKNLKWDQLCHYGPMGLWSFVLFLKIYHKLIFS
jgi:hypothetical protein